MLAKDERMGGFIVLYSKQDDAVVDYLYNEGLLCIDRKSEAICKPDRIY